MNKKMEKLYAEINFLFTWVEELKANHKEHPENEEKYSRLLTDIGLKIIDLMEQIDKERVIYHNQPLWKKLFRK